MPETSTNEEIVPADNDASSNDNPRINDEAEEETNEEPSTELSQTNQLNRSDSINEESASEMPQEECNAESTRCDDDEVVVTDLSVTETTKEILKPGK